MSYIRRCPFLAILLCTIFLLYGCFKNYDEIIKSDSATWSYNDLLIIMASWLSHNLIDNRTNIKVIATPYNPQVIMAIQRMAQKRFNWTEDEFKRNADILLQEAMGMYYKWNTRRFVDCRGNYIRSIIQLDSLLFLVTIENKGGGSYVPDISNIENQIFLMNDNGDTIKPKYVWGNKSSQLMASETLFVMFSFIDTDRHFLHGVNDLVLIIKGFESDIRLTFDASMMY
jgi:hypothetical protein